jgi:MFS family permease
MSVTRLTMRRLMPVWLSAWPLAVLALFAGGLALALLLPAGYARAVIAAPILLIVPGSLTLRAAFQQRYRPRGVVFACYAALLSVIWTVFASIALNGLGVLISTGSTYWCLVIISAVLAVLAEARILLENPGTGRRIAMKPEIPDPDLSDAEVSAAREPEQSGRTGIYAVMSVVVGIGLLCSGLYVYDHHRGPAPPGYTWIAWTGSRVTGALAEGAGGMTLPFQIVHHQSGTTTFEVSAVWYGSPSRPLAAPQTVSIGPDRTFYGTLHVPPLPGGCTYRLTVVLTAPGQIDPLTRKPQTWSINADVYDRANPAKACLS